MHLEVELDLGLLLLEHGRSSVLFLTAVLRVAGGAHATRGRLLCRRLKFSSCRLWHSVIAGSEAELLGDNSRRDKAPARTECWVLRVLAIAVQLALVIGRASQGSVHETLWPSDI